MPYRDPKARQRHNRQYYLSNRAACIAKAAKWAAAHQDERRAIARKCANKRNAELRVEVLVVYGGVCTCCGRGEPEFLGIDHVNNDGAEHRREIGGSGAKLYHWLEKHGFPKKGFQLLCHDCNHGKHAHGICPHKRPIEFKTRCQKRSYELKLRVLDAYGKSCKCCGQDNPAFLTVEHIFGGGKQHRAEVGRGTAFYRWLQKNGFPQGYLQILCCNCNHAKGSYGACPHKRCA